MEIHFVLTQADISNFTKYGLKQPRILVSLGVLTLLIVLIILMNGLTASAGSSDPTSSLLLSSLSVLVPLLLLLLVVLLLVRRVRSGASRRPGVLGAHSITIKPEGFRHQTDVSDSIISWRAIKEIKQDQHNIYFLVATNTVTAHIIPKRAFGDASAAETFFGWARSYWANGQGQAPVTLPGLPSSDLASPSARSTYERWDQ